MRMPFGSYKGKTLEQIYRVDPQYLMWARDEMKPPISEKIADFIAEKNRQIIERGKKSAL